VVGIGVPVVRVVVVLGRGKWDVGLVMHQVDSVGAKGRRRVKVDPVPGPGVKVPSRVGSVSMENISPASST